MRSLEDISPAQKHRANLNSVFFFLLSFVVIYYLNETYISLFQSFQILFFSVSFFPVLNFSLSTFLLSLSLYISISSTFSFSFCLFPCLFSTFFFAVFYLTPPTFFAYPLLSLSASGSFFVCLLISFFYFLPFFCYIPLTLLFIFSRVFYYYYYYYHYIFNCYLAAPRPALGHYRGGSLIHPMLITVFYIFDPKVTGSLVLSTCRSFLYFLSFNFLYAFSVYFSIFFFYFFSYFILFSTLFNYLVLILDFKYCNFSLLLFFL